ncbi:MAG: lasso peptide biosynthesis protein [Chitinivibrionales bacterium]|nr:lasso peptide biosynthesis protein [Chitinivibrionales bacterium]
MKVSPDNELTYKIIGCVIFLWFSSFADTALNWSILSCDDTLALFLKESHVGSVREKRALNNRDSSFTQTSVITLEQQTAEGNSPFSLESDLRYSMNGSLIKATQVLQSSTGTSRWSCARNSLSDQWVCTTTIAGITTIKRVERVGFSLKTTHAIIQGVLNKTMQKDQSWNDTIFDFLSLQNSAEKITCIDVGSSTIAYKFTTVDAVSQIVQYWELDSAARVVSQQIPPLFIARRITVDRSKITAMTKEKERGFSLEAVSESFMIPASRLPTDSESIEIRIDSSYRLHESVKFLYTKYSETRYKLIPQGDVCGKTKGKVSHRRDITWLRPTILIQSNNSQIIKVSQKICTKESTICERVGAATNYVYKTIQKRPTATLSNAYETLKSGNGDCGEHAALLTALLRAADIEATVVMGVVYVVEKKGYYYHAWVAFRDEVGTLLLADPALGVFPAVRGYVPLLIDDDGTHLTALTGLIGNLSISYSVR